MYRFSVYTYINKYSLIICIWYDIHVYFYLQNLWERVLVTRICAHFMIPGLDLTMNVIWIVNTSIVYRNSPMTTDRTIATSTQYYNNPDSTLAIWPKNRNLSWIANKVRGGHRSAEWAAVIDIIGSEYRVALSYWHWRRDERERHGIDIDTTSCIGSTPSILPIVTAIDSITITVRRFLSKRRKSADQTCLTSCDHRSLMTRRVRAA